MKHSVFPNRASAFYSVLICRGQFECWPGRADQVVSLQASRMRQLFKSSCLDLQFQPVGIASKGCFPAPGNAVASTPTSRSIAHPRRCRCRERKKKKALFPGFAISWPRPLLSEFPRDVHNSIWKQQRKTQAWQANDKAQDPGKMEF